MAKKDDVFINYIDKDTDFSPKMARHSLHSSKLSFVLGQETISQEIGLPEDLTVIWDQARSIDSTLS